MSEVGMLSEKEISLLKTDIGFPIIQIIILAAVALSGVIFAVLIWYKFIPIIYYFEEIHNFKLFLRMIVNVCFLPLCMYFLMFITFLVKNIITHYQRAKLLIKLQIDAHLKE